MVLLLPDEDPPSVWSISQASGKTTNTTSSTMIQSLNFLEIRRRRIRPEGDGSTAPQCGHFIADVAT
jgi:hypothetical protein